MRQWLLAIALMLPFAVQAEVIGEGNDYEELSVSTQTASAASYNGTLWLVATSAMHVALDTTTVSTAHAVSAPIYLPANTPVKLSTQGGRRFVIAVGDSGSLFITEVQPIPVQ